MTRASVLRLAPLSAGRGVVHRRRFDDYLESLERGHALGEVGPAQLHVARIMVRDARDRGQRWARLGVTGDATAFVVGDETTVCTTRHSFVRPADDDAQRRFEPLPAGERVEFVLIDDRDRIVFDTRRRGDSARVAACGDPAAAPAGSAALREAATDWVLIRLSRPVGRMPLAMRARARGGEPVTIVGYPERTADRMARYGAPDASGVDLRCTRGELLPRPPLSSDYYGERFASDDPVYRAAILHTTADGAPGASGGPIVGADGRVIGVFSFTTRAPEGTFAHGVPIAPVAAAWASLAAEFAEDGE